MFEKIKNLYFHLLRLRDIRVLSQVVFGAVVLLVTWSGIKSVQTNYELQKQISKLEQQNEVSQLENSNLGLQNQYYNTDQYLELAARRYFGLAKPGENLIIVPKAVAQKYIVPIKLPFEADIDKQPKPPARQRNFEAWIDFFLHRQNTN